MHSSTALVSNRTDPVLVVIAGTNGEAVTLSADEKTQLLRTARKIAIENGRPDLPITLGCSGQSTREVIAETKLAAAAGADFVLVLVPSYFHFAMDDDAIVAFFLEVPTTNGHFPDLSRVLHKRLPYI